MIYLDVFVCLYFMFLIRNIRQKSCHSRAIFILLIEGCIVLIKMHLFKTWEPFDEFEWPKVYRIRLHVKLNACIRHFMLQNKNWMKNFKNLLHKYLICKFINEFGHPLVKSFARCLDGGENFEKFVARIGNSSESKWNWMSVPEFVCSF